MNVNTDKLYTELRKTKKELINKLNDNNSSIRIKPYIEEELQDIELTIKKIENGQFGKCELSGELIPEHLLSMIPTLKTIYDKENIGNYFRKPLY